MKRLLLAVAMIAALLAIPQAAINGGARAAVYRERHPFGAVLDPLRAQ